jgi:glucosamine-phosphate N-acetyltransferase
MVGHLEEICVRKEYQGKGLGKALVEALNGVAQTIGCLKTILNCSPEKSGFYEKCGYSKGGLDMSRKFEGCETDGSSSESSSE